MILLLKYSFYVVDPKNFPFFKWQYRAGAGAGAKIKEKVEPELEPKLNYFGSATLLFLMAIFFDIGAGFIINYQWKLIMSI